MPQVAGLGRQPLRIGWFGTSIMEHPEAVSSRLHNQLGLPPVGSRVTVDAHRRGGGYLGRLRLALRADYPSIAIEHDLLAVSGATSRAILAVVSDTVGAGVTYDIAWLEAGINDVWAAVTSGDGVDIDEFADNYRRILRLLTKASSRQVVCLGEAPFGPPFSHANDALAQYNKIAAQAAADFGAAWVDVWERFNHVADHLTRDESLWTDGGHLSPLGDTIILRAAQRQMAHLIGAVMPPSQAAVCPTA